MVHRKSLNENHRELYYNMEIGFLNVERISNNIHPRSLTWDPT